MTIISGILKKVLWRNEKTGRCIISVQPFEATPECDSYGCIVCKGVSPDFLEYTPLKVEGEFILDEDRGSYYFCISNIQEYSKDKNASLKYLSSSLFKGVGVKLAEKIIDAVGCDIFEAAGKDDFVSILISVGVEPETAKEVKQVVLGTTNQRIVSNYLADKNVDFSCVLKLCKKYGTNALVKLSTDPFLVGQECGMTINSCDLVAIDNHIHEFDARRVQAYAKKVLLASATAGHTYMDFSTFVDNVRKLMEQNAAYGREKKKLFVSPLIETAIYNDKSVVVEESEQYGRIFVKSLYFDEIGIAKNLWRLIRNSKSTPFDPRYVQIVEMSNGFEYAQEQRIAFELLRTTSPAILTGGPGSGKTTTLKGLLDVWQMMYPTSKILCCAPTGKAAQRMSESTGRKATTIHKALEYQPYGDITVGRDENNPIEADFIVIDEMSMTDASIGNMLLSAVKSGTKVLFVGDVDQLQSVGAGDVLNDIIRASERLNNGTSAQTNILPICKLTQSHRQSNESNIKFNAKAINLGYDGALKKADDFIIKTVTQMNVTQTVVEIIKKIHNPISPYDVQVLCPVHKGDGGENDINTQLQAILNGGNTKSLDYGHTRFKVGDKVIFVKNNSESGYFNGDTGIIEDVNNGLIIALPDKKIALTKDNLADVNLAYALTVHKSQGSEFDTVVIALPECKMLQRNLLYTAVTRAKKNVIIVEGYDCITKAIRTSNMGKRKTMLANRIVKEGGRL